MKRSFKISVGWLIFVTIIALFIGIRALEEYATQESVTDTVLRVDRVTGRNDSYWLVTCSHEVFKNTDDIFMLKFNSSDVIRKMPAGYVSTFVVNGWRMPLLSGYRNILYVYQEAIR